MEGRTIARPNIRRQRSSRRAAARFNGGPDNCPAKLDHVVRVHVDGLASMEGRTIARPNLSEQPWYGYENLLLQWRAGQLPGQTCSGCQDRGSASARFNGGPDNCPAKPCRWSPTGTWCTCFNGGPDNCPAKRGRRQSRERAGDGLQWRAGQLPGQTLDRRVAGRVPLGASMEGRTIARPNQHRPSTQRAEPRASMEGRTIARPNQAAQAALHVPADASMEGRTIARPNLCVRIGVVAVEPRASMEGRTIARPNELTDIGDGVLAYQLQWRAGQLPGQTTRLR